MGMKRRWHIEVELSRKFNSVSDVGRGEQHKNCGPNTYFSQSNVFRDSNEFKCM